MTLTPDWNISNPVTYARMRQSMLESGGGLQEGVVGANDLKVAQRGAGANMSVDVPAGAAWVQIDTGTRNGLGHVYNDATANVVVTASNGTNPRIDQILLRWNDSSIPTGSGNVPTLEVLTGTATAGATLANRTGAAALPNDCLRLADLLIPAASSSVITANIADRRPWARGATRTLERTAGDLTGLTTGNWTNIDAATLLVTAEFSGVPVKINLSGTGAGTSVGNTVVLFGYSVDGDLVGGTTSTARSRQSGAPQGVGFTFGTTWMHTGLSAGRHTIQPIFRMSVGTLTIYSSTTNGSTQFSVEEIIRPNIDNT